MKKAFTEKEVSELIKATIDETTGGVFEWLTNETNVVDKKTGEIIDDNTEIDINAKYIYPRLVKHGIIIKHK